MIERPFSLKPFIQEDVSSDFNITGRICRDEGKIIIMYELCGPIEELIIPACGIGCERMDRLWEETCFEFFLNPQNTCNYWEFNLSPSGHWNIYRFNDYRKDMQKEKAFVNLPFSIHKGPEIMRLTLEFKVDIIIPKDRAINIGVSAVMKDMNNRITYWALDHHGEIPDFHRQDVFLIDL